MAIKRSASHQHQHQDRRSTSLAALGRDGPDLSLSPAHHTLVWQGRGRGNQAQLPSESLVVPSFPTTS